MQTKNKIKTKAIPDVTFVVVGGGFSGVETVGELNEFVRESVRKYYRNIPQDSVKVVLVASGAKNTSRDWKPGSICKGCIGKVRGDNLHRYTKLKDASRITLLVLSIQEKRFRVTVLVWAGGNKVDDTILNLSAEHDERSGRIIVDGKLRLESHPEVFAIGDCAYVTDSRSGQTLSSNCTACNTTGTHGSCKSCKHS